MHLEDKNKESVRYAALELRNVIEIIAYYQIKRQYTKFMFKEMYTTKKGKMRKLGYTKEGNFWYSRLSGLVHVKFDEHGVEDINLDESYAFLKECLENLGSGGDLIFGLRKIFFICDCGTDIKDSFYVSENNFIRCEGCEQIYEIKQEEDGKFYRYELTKNEINDLFKWIEEQRPR